MPVPGSETCRICSGPLRLLYAGSGIEFGADAFSPTNHVPGQYGDLFACERCGTVQQPSLPHGDSLLELYRQMRDEHYLDEEEGRRRTAGRVLDRIGRRVPSGRLLDVGCGHGLLLDEARKRGYDAEGLELSVYALAHAREVLNLRVREQTVGDLLAEPEPPTYAAIVLADVLEHLDDPLETIDACLELLAPGGVLCLVTPDPASRTARIAGPRWWGFLPAHTFLLPRKTLRELLERRGLDVTDDIGLVRSFSLRYWMAGLAERGGAVGKATEAAQKLAPRHAQISLSLGDETVLIAQKGARVTPRSAPAPAPPRRSRTQPTAI